MYNLKFLAEVRLKVMLRQDKPRGWRMIRTDRNHLQQIQRARLLPAVCAPEPD